MGMAWHRYHLTQNPEVMRKLEQELDEAGLLETATRPSPRPLQYTDLYQLTYLNWILKVYCCIFNPAFSPMNCLLL